MSLWRLEILTAQEKEKGKKEEEMEHEKKYRLQIRIPEDVDSAKRISSTLYGIFLEDINYAVDGGMYGEMVKNRSFEYGCWAEDGAWHGWTKVGDIRRVAVDGSLDRSYLNPNNVHYARLHNDSEELAGIAGSGYLEGMFVRGGEEYRFSVFARGRDGYPGKLTIRLVEDEEPEEEGCIGKEEGENLAGRKVSAGDNGRRGERKTDRGNPAGMEMPVPEKTGRLGKIPTHEAEFRVLARAEVKSLGPEWQKYEVKLCPKRSSVRPVRCQVLIGRGTVEIDMVSLFPVKTFKGRKNGIRREIGQALAELNPRFLRFPGGCVTEGHTLDNAYDWKDSIGNGMEFVVNGVCTVGDPAARKHSYNLWGVDRPDPENPYYMTYGIGYYEYFLLCEDLGCLPVPVVNSGMSCQFRGKLFGQAKDVAEPGSLRMQRYIRDALDLAEFCRGDESTKWGNIRIRMGHPEPFPLQYIGIGNEQWGEEYFEHYEAFLEAFREAAHKNPKIYGGIELIVSNGPGSGDTWAWDRIAEKGKWYAGLVDEHYYENPEWFLENTRRYDTYDRTLPPVFVGEYAARSNTLGAALAEAAYMTGLERNGDMVAMASYAPLLGNDTAIQWEPDLLWFDGRDCRCSVNYYVQQMFAGQVGFCRAESCLDVMAEEGEEKSCTGEGESRQELYHSVTMEEGRALILKLVNVSAQPGTLCMDVEGYRILPDAQVVVLAGRSLNEANTAEYLGQITPVKRTLKTEEGRLSYKVPGYSVSVIRMETERAVSDS